MKGEVKTYLIKIKKRFLNLNRHQIILFGSLFVLIMISFVLIINKYQVQPEPVAVESQIFIDPNKRELLPEEIEDIQPVKNIQAIAAVNNKEISGLELEYQEGVLLYIAHFGDGSSQAYNALTAEEAASNISDTEIIQTNDRLPPEYTPSVSFAGALIKAKEQNNDMQAVKIVLGIETSLAMYSVYFNEANKIFISATTGNIVTIAESDPIVYTAASTTSNTTTKDNKDWRDKWIKIKNDRRKKIEEYVEDYYNRD